ncbi:MAG: hypothetical protein QOF73_688 [Thermomicrobiales bacterium]|nr:hypothetical protein [Thermomicrobiales bacterium]
MDASRFDASPRPSPPRSRRRLVRTLAGAALAALARPGSPLPAQAQDDPCTEEKLLACRATPPPDCLPGEVPALVLATCCRSCKSVATPGVGNTPCTKQALRACLAQMPVCLPGEDPERVEGRCCSSCKRPETSCVIEDQIRCHRNQPECLPGENPVLIPAECCPTCRVPAVACAPVGEVCAAHRQCCGKRCQRGGCCTPPLAACTPDDACCLGRCQKSRCCLRAGIACTGNCAHGTCAPPPA